MVLLADVVHNFVIRFERFDLVSNANATHPMHALPDESRYARTRRICET